MIPAKREKRTGDTNAATNNEEQIDNPLENHIKLEIKDENGYSWTNETEHTLGNTNAVRTLLHGNDNTGSFNLSSE